MKTVAGQMTAMASPEAVRSALAQMEPVPKPSFTLGWRGRTSVRVLDGRPSVRLDELEKGLVRVTCRWSLRGPLLCLMGPEYCSRLREDLRQVAAAICRRAEALEACSSDGRPPPVKEAGSSP